VRGVGGVAPARDGVELNIAQELCLEPPLEPGITVSGIILVPSPPPARTSHRR
jgi:hypothetical protein